MVGTILRGVPSGGSDLQLLQGVSNGNFKAVKAALQAGANVNGPPEQPCPPIAAAAIADQATIVNFLLEQGADPDRPVTEELPHPCTKSDMAAAAPGERALHIAARSGNVDIVRLLLERAHADPNATDKKGCTPLLAVCDSSNVKYVAEIVQLLLGAGGDPALAEENGIVPLHVVSYRGYLDLVDDMHSRSPSTLNRCASKGQTPLFLACVGGHETVVSRLLSLGAVQPMPAEDDSMLPLSVAVSNGFLGVVRVLLSEKGITAIGGRAVLPNALFTVVKAHDARILRLLLAVDGQEKRLAWANTLVKGRYLLHYAAGYCCPAAVSILLEAGADEAACDSEGRIAGDVIGVGLGRDGGIQMDRGKEDSIRRMLQRGPAYRAQSWALPSDATADAGGSDGGGGAAAALSSQPTTAVPKAPVSGWRIFRPKEQSSSNKLFVRVVDR